MPDSTNKARITGDTLKDIYVRKMVKVRLRVAIL